jgi:hypothetical protein
MNLQALEKTYTTKLKHYPKRSLDRFAPSTASPVTMPRYSLICFPSIFGVVVMSMDGVRRLLALKIEFIKNHLNKNLFVFSPLKESSNIPCSMKYTDNKKLILWVAPHLTVVDDENR